MYFVKWLDKWRSILIGIQLARANFKEAVISNFNRFFSESLKLDKRSVMPKITKQQCTVVNIVFI